MKYVRAIENLLTELEHRIQGLQKNISLAPAGKLITKNVKGTLRIIRRIPNVPDEYLGHTKLDLVRALAQKKYDIQTLKVLLQDKTKLEKLLLDFKDPKHITIEKVWENFPEHLKEYITQEPLSDEGYIQNWNQEDNLFKKKINNNSQIYSLRGERVESKSEALIADRLLNAGIPYHYEKELFVDHGEVLLHPDFTVLNPKTLKTYYWEHLGKIDNTEYSFKAKKRIELLARNGIIQGKNLIISFETSTSPLNTTYVDLLIREFLQS